MMVETLIIDSPHALNKVKETLVRGRVIAYPTETFYGLGVDAFNEDAIKRVFDLKGREEGKPIPILVKDREMLLEVVEAIPPLAEDLIKGFWPGPLTIVFKARPILPAILTGGTGKVGVRVSSNPIAQRIVEAFGKPLTTTSANPSGQMPATTVQEVADYFGGRIDLIIDGGPLPGRLGSTVVDVTGEGLVIMREGEVRPEELYSLIYVK